MAYRGELRRVRPRQCVDVGREAARYRERLVPGAVARGAAGARRCARWSVAVMAASRRRGAARAGPLLREH